MCTQIVILCYEYLSCWLYYWRSRVGYNWVHNHQDTKWNEILDGIRRMETFFSSCRRAQTLSNKNDKENRSAHIWWPHGIHCKVSTMEKFKKKINIQITGYQHYFIDPIWAIIVCTQEWFIAMSIGTYRLYYWLSRVEYNWLHNYQDSKWIMKLFWI